MSDSAGVMPARKGWFTNEPMRCLWAGLLKRQIFDRHRAGKHEYLFSIEKSDGRRCLSLDEMTGLGWERNPQGRWNDPERSEKTTQAFAKKLDRQALRTSRPERPGRPGRQSPTASMMK